jgi:hypothetical protein
MNNNGGEESVVLLGLSCWDIYYLLLQLLLVKHTINNEMIHLLLWYKNVRTLLKSRNLPYSKITW